MKSMIIEYELLCSCGIVKHDKTRSRILEWWLEHKQEGDHKMTLLWFLNNRFRIVTEQEIDKFIKFIQSDKKKQNEQKNPWGLEGLGFHNNPLE